MRLIPLNPRYFFAVSVAGEPAIWERNGFDCEVQRVAIDRARWLCAHHRGEALSLKEGNPDGAEYHRARFLELHEALAKWRSQRFPQITPPAGETDDERLERRRRAGHQ